MSKARAAEENHIDWPERCDQFSRELINCLFSLNANPEFQRELFFANVLCLDDVVGSYGGMSVVLELIQANRAFSEGFQMLNRVLITLIHGPSHRFIMVQRLL